MISLNALRVGLFVLCGAGLVGCQSGLFFDSGSSSLSQRVRGVGQDEQTGLQIYGLRNPIVSDLMQQALAAENRRQWSQAAELLIEALRIEPEAPDILQQLAEVRLEQGQWADALRYAQQSIDLGPRVGHLCKRNWRAIAWAQHMQGDAESAGQAIARVPLCERTRPERF